MFASSGERTAPTQWATWRSVAVGGGDRVADGDGVVVAADEYFAHDEAQDALLFLEGQLVEPVAEAGEEAFELVDECRRPPPVLAGPRSGRAPRARIDLAWTPASPWQSRHQRTPGLRTRCSSRALATTVSAVTPAFMEISTHSLRRPAWE